MLTICRRMTLSSSVVLVASYSPALTLEHSFYPEQPTRSYAKPSRACSWLQQSSRVATNLFLKQTFKRVLGTQTEGEYIVPYSLSLFVGALKEARTTVEDGLPSAPDNAFELVQECRYKSHDRKKNLQRRTR